MQEPLRSCEAVAIRGSTLVATQPEDCNPVPFTGSIIHCKSIFFEAVHNAKAKNIPVRVFLFRVMKEFNKP